jgi:hypothetical protein
METFLIRTYPDQESSSFPSSQVFHTPTGLRAADPEAAQSLNPFQRIGQLGVGHIVYRLQGDKYEAEEIKTIEETKETTLDRVMLHCLLTTLLP